MQPAPRRVQRWLSRCVAINDIIFKRVRKVFPRRSGVFLARAPYAEFGFSADRYANVAGPPPVCHALALTSPAILVGRARGECAAAIIK